MPSRRIYAKTWGWNNVSKGKRLMSVTPAKKTSAAYDEVPYESYSYPQTHARHLYVVGTLFNLSPPPPDFRGARVLEIGCASGGNLFPQAINYPNASFVGIDLSAEQVAIANRHKEQLGLKNIEFRQQDILAFDPKKEKIKYDYIIAHGVFSWVPEKVRAALLDLCGTCLAPDGLAVISYNTLPGWNAIRSLREMMLYHIGRFPTPAEKVSQARALLDFLLESVPENNTAYRALIQGERDLLKNLNDSYIFHDHLEEVNAQFYLNDFLKQAHDKGLEYVGDTQISSMYVGNLPPKAMEHLKAVGDIAAQEQYMDFVTNRRFRSTILQKKGRRIARDLRPEQIMDFHLAPNYAPDPAASGNDTASFNGVGGGRFTAKDAPAVALFRTLWANGPRPVSAADLIARAAKETGQSEPVLRATLINYGVQLTLLNYIVLHADCPDITSAISAKPVVWPLARLQASRPGCTHVTNVLSGMVKTDEAGAVIISGLDGTRDEKEIVDLVVAAIGNGRIKATKDGQPVTDGAAIRPQLENTVKSMLPRLVSENLLVG
jgi:methyltransferase-like protein/SAM-dependent methyltransferase